MAHDYIQIFDDYKLVSTAHVATFECWKSLNKPIHTRKDTMINPSLEKKDLLSKTKHLFASSPLV